MLGSIYFSCRLDGHRWDKGLELRTASYRRNQTVIQTVNTIGSSTALHVSEKVNNILYGTLAFKCSLVVLQGNESAGRCAPSAEETPT